MWKRLQTRPARDHADVVSFFDASAAGYAEQHGDADRLLDYRLSLLRKAADFTPTDEVLEIGCGDGKHLIGLASEFARGSGVDISPAMVEVARRRAESAGYDMRFCVDTGEALATAADDSADVVLAVGTLEHMLDQPAVCRSVFRVLRPGGRFVCLTLNGGSLWYGALAPALGVDTRQLSTDHYASAGELERWLGAAGFDALQIHPWTFVQRGDLHPWVARSLAGLDRVGRLLRLRALRGGLRVRAVKPWSLAAQAALP